MAKSKSSCTLCSRKDTCNMVKCDKCQKWQHFKCAGVTRAICGSEYICVDCRNAEQASNDTSVSRQQRTSLSNVVPCSICHQGVGAKGVECFMCGVSIHGRCGKYDQFAEVWQCIKCYEQPDRFDGAAANKKKTPSVCSGGSTSSRRKAKLLLIEESKKRAEALLEQQRSIDASYFDAMWRELDSDNDSVCSGLSGGGRKAEADRAESMVGNWFESFQTRLKGQPRWSSHVDESSKGTKGARLSNPSRNVNVSFSNNADVFTMRLPRSSDLNNDHGQSENRGVRREGQYRLSDVNAERQRNHLERERFGRPRPELQQVPLCDRNDMQNRDYDVHRLTDRQIAARHAQSQRSALPDFSGNPREWPVFISAYYYSTTDCGYSNQENLVRLQRCLKGQARNDVEGLLLSPDSVPEVLETLEIIYGSPESIIYAQLKELRSWPSVKDNDLRGLTRLALKVRNVCAIIRSCRILAHLANPELVQEVVEKLPSNLKLDWALHKLALQREPNMVAFSDWLFAIGTAAATVTRDSGPAFSESKGKTNNQSKLKGSLLHQSASNESNPVMTKQTAQSKPPLRCKCCDAEHDVDMCPKFNEMNIADRWEFVNKHKRCRSCLGNHLSFRCRRKRRCGINGCERIHNRLLHSNENVNNDNAVTPHSSTSNSTPSPPTQQHTQGSINTSSSNHHQCDKSVFFRIAPVTLFNGDQAIDTYAFMDEGSSVTLVDEKLANQLRLEGSREALCLKWTGDTTREEENSRKVNVSISQRCGQRKFAMNDVRTVSNLDLPLQSCSVGELCSKYNHLKGLPIMSYQNARPEILIGMNNWQLAVPIEVREGRWQDPVAVRTRLGWVICGPRSTSQTPKYLNLHSCKCNVRDDELNESVKKFFSMESFGTKPDVKFLKSAEDTRALELLESSTVYKDGRYEAGILWRDDVFEMPETRSMARKRLICLERKMLKSPDLASDLRKQMREYKEKGYVRKLSAVELAIKNPRAWYLPMFVVEHPFKQKRRIVWDAAACVNGVSFNSYTIPGPDDIPLLPNILFKFRENLVAICGDLREMYHQVKIAEKDKCTIRFLWRDEMTDEPEDYTAEVWLFGINCAGTVVQHVVNVNASRLRAKFPRAAKAIHESHYRDDWLDSFNTDDEALQVAKEVRFVHSEGGFEMRNWVSNSKRVVAELGDKTCMGTERMPISSRTEKVLGMFWEPDSDCIVFVLNRKRIDMDSLMKSPPTKRVMLRTVMLVFDPLGLVSCVMVLGKMLIQDVWRKSIGWDECIDADLFAKWRSWLKMLAEIESLRIPRCYRSLNRPTSLIEMHTFVDASESAYSAVVYFRFVDDGRSEVSLVTSKTKVAPNKPVSVPRLELMAAVLGARLASNVAKAHRMFINRRCYWSDSKTVLSWIGSEARKYNQFVGLRIGELLELTNVDEWRWIPSKMNVADDATKWRDVTSISFTRWLDGPNFLKSSIETDMGWHDDENDIDEYANTELRSFNVHCKVALCEPSTPDVDNFSLWSRLWRSQAYALRLCCNWLARCKDTVFTKGTYTPDEMQRAEFMLFRRAQWDCWKDEIFKLATAGCEKLSSSSPIFPYSAYLDENFVIRSFGRIENASVVDESIKRKIILPPNHSVTKLVIEEYHDKYLHRNHETVLNEIRQRFIIPRVRQIYNKIRNACQRCKNERVKPIPPKMGDLPPARLAAFTRPFSYVGLDYFGPFEVIIGRRSEKRWGSLFTCMTTRAVHIELSTSLSSSSFIMCLRNFINRRGEPVEIFCDNGTNFRGASVELSKEIEKIDYDASQNKYPRIKWTFIPPQSPHMGGAWERLVRTVKSNLMEVIPSRRPTEEVLRSFLIEVENIVNSRPLTHVPIDPEEPEAITPNHFILGMSSKSGVVGCFDCSGEVLLNSWKKARAMSDHFWHRWVKEYLPDLCRRTKWHTPAEPLQAGDIVIVVDSKNERGRWPMAVVEEVFKGKDGQTRSARIKTSVGTYVRPTVKLAKLDIANSSRTCHLPSSSTGVEDVGDRTDAVK